MRRHLAGGLAAVLLLATVLVAAAATWGYLSLRASLPPLDGRLPLPGLEAPVEIVRDGLGIPTIRARSRRDAARATGLVHAQDRFFQMDLARRQSAGELAELAGAAAVPLDRDIRRHRFRTVAREAVARLDAADRAILDAYAAGVNAGVDALGAAPAEYTVLRQEPRPWRAEDSLLVVLSMFVTLQDARGGYESTLATLYDVLPAPMADFLAPRQTGWDAPLTGGTTDEPAIPGPGTYDLRSRRAGHPRARTPPQRSRGTRGLPDDSLLAVMLRPPDASDTSPGSNNWAVSGRLTEDGGALVANDAHLTIRVPNTWYRLVLEWPDGADASRTRQVVGVTLPGLPNVVIGSNGQVSWGFTNTYGDWSDIVLLDVDPDAPSRYRTPDGWRTFDDHEEEIAVAGETSRPERVAWTIWGPVIDPDHRGRPRAFRWVAHDAERLAAGLTPLETAESLDEAFAAAHGIGAPGQNIVAADRDGRIGWTVYGSLPRRTGFDGRVPVAWSDGTNGWRGWLQPAEYPRVVDPPDGRLWTANARVASGEMLETIGDGGYDMGARAWIIRDRLMGAERFSAADMLRMQLDVGADFIARWRARLLDTLASPGAASTAGRARLRALVQERWSGEARPESVAYTLTRMFRDEVFSRVEAFVLVECYEADPAFDYGRVRTREAPIWALVTEQPIHLLDPQYDTWNDLLLAAADAVIEDAGGVDALGERTWAAYNVTAYRHPLSAQIPFAAPWLDMPLAPLPGDAYTVRVQWRAVGASFRMVVSPGREDRGIMQMPTGQSGHPLSPFYRNSHDAWVNGAPTPLLPGPAVHRLLLEP